MKIYLVSCVSQKHTGPLPARELYCSPWFQKARAVAEAQGDRWFILSAFYGMLRPDTVIESYNITLRDLPDWGRRNWSAYVTGELLSMPDLLPGDEVVILAGRLYAEGIVPALERMGITVTTPLAGLGIGQQLQAITRMAEGVRGE